MTVRCPECGTLFRRPGRGHGTFRCARCRHVFDEAPAEPAFVEADDRTVHEEEDDDAFVLEEPPAAPAPRRPATARAPVPADDAESGGVTAPRFALRAVVLVTLAYGLLSAWLVAQPARARRALRHVPLIGGTLAEPRLDPAAVQLGTVRGQYERVRGDQLVFVVSGTAVNAAAVPVRGIQIEAFVAGAEVRRQVVFCGGAPRDVRDLSLREIALLQTIEPPRDWALPPGAETTFLVVFPSPPPDLREFGAEVVAVRAPKARA